MLEVIPEQQGAHRGTGARAKPKRQVGAEVLRETHMSVWREAQQQGVAGLGGRW